MLRFGFKAPLLEDDGSRQQGGGTTEESKLFKVVTSDGEVDVTEEELKLGYMRQADATKKWEAAAQARKEVNEMKEQLEAEKAAFYEQTEQQQITPPPDETLGLDLYGEPVRKLADRIEKIESAWQQRLSEEEKQRQIAEAEKENQKQWAEAKEKYPHADEVEVLTAALRLEIPIEEAAKRSQDRLLERHKALLEEERKRKEETGKPATVLGKGGQPSSSVKAPKTLDESTEFAKARIAAMQRELDEGG